jgi:oligopeptidase A
MLQLALAKLDLELHLNYQKYAGRALDEVEREILTRYRLEDDLQMPCSARDFGHIFGQPTYYAAGYYSYKWAEVLDADAFQKFKDDGVISAEVGKRFRREVLAKGASDDADVLFRNFMGRDPDPTAFLARSGICSTKDAALA